MHYSHFLRPFALALFLIGSSPAATLVYNAELGILEGGFLAGTGYTTFAPLGPVPKLNGALNPGDQFQFTYSAPAGFLFRILPVTAAGTFGGFYADWWDSGQIFSPVGHPTGSASFAAATAPAPVPTAQAITLGTTISLASTFRAFVDFAPGDFTFKSITATFTIPSGLSKTFTDFTPATVQMIAFYSSDSDLGPAATLVRDTSSEIPEPASALLIPGALALLALSKRARSTAKHHRQ